MVSRFSVIAFLSIFLFVACEKEPEPRLDLSVETLMLPNNGGSGSFDVVSNGAWTATVASTWCSISPTSGNGNGTINVIATDNIGVETRSVFVKVSSRGLSKSTSVIQDIATLELSRDTIIASKERVSHTLDIISNTFWQVEIPEGMEWLSVTPSSGTGNASITVTLEENHSYKRNATIEVKFLNRSESIEVSQERGANRAPEKPLLKSPLDNSSNINRLPAFRWNSSVDPDGDNVKYLFQLSENQLSWDYSVETTDTLFYLNDFLKENTNYYWQITAIDDFDNSASEPSTSGFMTGTGKSYFNGEYRLYHENTKGQKPSVIIFMGDGYQAEDHFDGGRYDNHLDEGIEAFFSVEPYKSYREYFTVYKVGAYSRDSGVKQTDKNLMKHSVFETDFLGGSSLSTNTDKVFDYARVVPGIDDEALKNTLIVLVVNENRYAGTCWMWSDGKAIAIVPVSRSGQDGQAYPNIVNHEAGGHGYGRLADEYISSQNIGKTLPESDVTSFQSWVRNGFYPNVDLTGNLNEVKWKYFLGEPGYSRVGTYEGAYYYTYGAWRPETSSCMVHNEQYYNAPSREAMVKRILKTAGETFSFEIFLEKDVQKSPDAKMATKSFNPLTFIPLAPPVMVR
jgi:hypothetical protein